MSDTAVAKRGLATPMVQTMQTLMPHVPALLPPDISTEQFRAALYLELSGRPALAECTTESLREAVIKAASYGLLPGRDCHILPFTNKRKGGKKDATYVPNYFGVILALERSGKIRRAFAHPVHEGDEWSFDVFQDRPVHRPAVTLGHIPGKVLFYYGAVMFKDGACAFEVVTLEELDAIRRSAPAHESGPWVTDHVMMCRKSCIKRVAKYVRLTPEQRQMLEDDALREQEDIPPARHQQTVEEVFGEDAASPARNPTQPRPPPAAEAAPTPWRDHLQTLATTLLDLLNGNLDPALASRVQQACEQALRGLERPDLPQTQGEAWLETLRTLQDEVTGQLRRGE